MPWVNGVKTGYTIDAGNVLVASGKQGGVELVSAVLGAPTESERDAASLQLLEYGFSQYHRRTPVRKGKEVTEVGIADRDVAVALAPTEDVRITVRKGQDVATRVRAPAEVDGPVDDGERLGEVIVSVDGEAVGRTPLVATASASAAEPGRALRRRRSRPQGGGLGDRDRCARPAADRPDRGVGSAR